MQTTQDRGSDDTSRLRGVAFKASSWNARSDSLMGPGAIVVIDVFPYHTARLGGWAERKGNKPGKIVLTRGLCRLLDMLVTQAVLARYRSEHGDLPPQIAAFLGPSPAGEL